MSDSIYIEDIFREFYLRTAFSVNAIPPGEIQAIENFNDLCLMNKPLTEKQSRYMIALLKKYRKDICDKDFDYTDALSDPKFRNPFRVIDETRRVYVEKVDDDVNLYLKFPYSFKETFEKEFATDGQEKIRTIWDQDRQARYLDLYSVNLVWVQSFAETHGFETESSFLEAVAETEEAWENQDSIIPFSLIENDQVVLKNAPESAEQWFHKERSGSIEKDLLLAKIAGFLLRSEGTPTSYFGKIAASDANNFWIKDLAKFFGIFKTLETKCCIIMDRTEDRKAWIERFVSAAETSMVQRSLIKVCFREKAADDPFNVWIKDQGIGGKTEQGKIFIFEQKPAKWVFRHIKEFKIIATTSINSPMNLITRDWLSAHPLAFYLTDIKPTQKGQREIVEL
jgi:hypothetical protein